MMDITNIDNFPSYVSGFGSSIINIYYTLGGVKHNVSLPVMSKRSSDTISNILKRLSGK